MARKEGLIGRKVGMTQVFADDGNQVPVTVIQAGPCTVVGVRTRDSHGYDALQLGFEARKKNVTKPMAGHFKKANVEPMRIVREIRLDKAETLQGYQVGQAVTAELFKPGELVDVVGVTKGKGFQGGVRRYGWYGGDATHGSMFHRAPGSIGASSDPSRVWPGHHLPAPTTPRAAVRCRAAARSRGSRRAPAAPARAPSARPSGRAAASRSVPRRTATRRTCRAPCGAKRYGRPWRPRSPPAS